MVFNSANTPAISSAFLSAISGLVLYLIRVRFIILSMSGSANGEHRFFRDRRSAPAKGFGPKKFFGTCGRRHAGAKRLCGNCGAPDTSPDDTVLLSVDWQTGLGPGPLSAYISRGREI